MTYDYHTITNYCSSTTVHTAVQYMFEFEVMLYYSGILYSVQYFVFVLFAQEFVAPPVLYRTSVLRSSK